MSIGARRDDDRGNTMIIAMAVLMIMGILAAAIWAKTISGLRYAGYDKTHLATLSVADSGIDEATFRLEQLDPEAQSTLDIVELDGAGSMSGGDYEYIATRKTNIEWEVTAVAEVDGVRRAIRADAVTRPKHGFAFETVSGLDLNGSPSDICSYDSSEVGPAFGEQCMEELQGPIIGAGGAIKCSGEAWNDVPVMIFPPAGSSNCADETQSPSSHEWDPPVAPIAGGLATLQDNAAGDCFVSAADLWAAPPGAYNCRDLVLGPNGDEDLCTNDTVDMWDNVSIHVWGKVTYGNGVYVNVADLAGRGCKPNVAGPWMGQPPFYPTEAAGAFRVYVSSAGTIDIQQGAKLPAASMVLYAPYSEAVANGSPNLRVFGSLFLNTFTVNGAIDVVGYDRSLSRITTKAYKIVNWREIPPPIDVGPSPSPSFTAVPAP